MTKSRQVDCMSIIYSDIKFRFNDRINRIENAIDLTSIQSMKDKLSIERTRIVAARDDVLTTLKQHKNSNTE